MSKRSRRNKRQPKIVVRSNPAPSPLGDGLGLPPSIAGAMAAQVTRTYSGPIPPPEILREFDQVDPGRAAKLLQLAEDQTRHRMDLESRVIKSDLRRSWAGLACAFLITMTALTIGGGLVYQGHSIAGTMFAGLGLTGLTGSFIYGTRSRRAEREAKQKLVTGKK